MSRSPSDCSSRARDLLQQAVARVVAERVVDLLEVVEVDQHHGGGDVGARGRRCIACSMRSRKSVRFGQAGERVVQRLVLLGDRVAAAAVDREERQQQQRSAGSEKSAASTTIGERPSSRPAVEAWKKQSLDEVAPDDARPARARRPSRPATLLTTKKTAGDGEDPGSGRRVRTGSVAVVSGRP